MTAHFGFIVPFLQAGYEDLVFDYRGYRKSADKASQKSTVEDGIAVLKWAQSYARQKPQTTAFVFTYKGSMVLDVFIVQPVRAKSSLLFLARAEDFAHHVERGAWLKPAFTLPMSLSILFLCGSLL